jgi:hypothetical protein
MAANSQSKVSGIRLVLDTTLSIFNEEPVTLVYLSSPSPKTFSNAA